MTTVTDNKKINAVLYLCYGALLMLLLNILWDSLWNHWQNNSAYFWTPLLRQSIPLLLLIPGLIKPYYRSYSWLCFLSLLYFTSYVIQVYSSHRQVHDWLGLLAAIVLFVSGMFASRWLQRYVGR